MKREHGFSLIELVIVMVLVGAGFVGIATLLGSNVRSLDTNEILQQATQHAQHCAESAMQIRRNLGYTWFNTNVFSCGANPAGFTYSTAASTPPLVSAAYTGGANTACPNGISCRDVTITATHTATGLNASISLLLVNHP